MPSELLNRSGLPLPEVMPSPWTWVLVAESGLGGHLHRLIVLTNGSRVYEILSNFRPALGCSLEADGAGGGAPARADCFGQSSQSGAPSDLEGAWPSELRAAGDDARP